MTILKTNIPEASLLNRSALKCDYTDSFQSMISDRDNKIKPENIGTAFFSSAPIWVQMLFSLRNKIVRLFGLKDSKNTGRKDMMNKHLSVKGDLIGSFKIYEKTADEIILGQDDKHLNFRISFFLKNINEYEKQLTISTIVIFKNLFGKLYFLVVKSFHRIIVPAMLRAMMRSIAIYEN